MNSSPLVSVCIPTYNGEKYLKECLDSVLSQSYKNIEIVIIDDCSTDSSIAIVEAYAAKDTRIHLHKNNLNKGLVGNWNRAIELAKGEWIKFVFQDDLIVKDCIEKQLNAAKNHSFVTCDREFIFDNSVSEFHRTYYSKELLTLKKLADVNGVTYFSDRQISKYAVENISLNFFGEPTAVMFKKELIKEFGNFNADLSQICDLEFWLRIATKLGVVYIPEKLVSFRIHADSVTNMNVLSSKKFTPRYIDSLLLTHELFFSNIYSHFRTLISITNKKKLMLFIKSKMYEAKLAFEKDTSVNRNFFKELFNKYPALSKYYNASLSTRIIFKIVLLKRSLK